MRSVPAEVVQALQVSGGVAERKIEARVTFHDTLLRFTKITDSDGAPTVATPHAAAQIGSFIYRVYKSGGNIYKAAWAISGYSEGQTTPWSVTWSLLTSTALTESEAMGFNASQFWYVGSDSRVYACSLSNGAFGAPAAITAAIAGIEAVQPIDTSYFFAIISSRLAVVNVNSVGSPNYAPFTLKDFSDVHFTTACLDGEYHVFFNWHDQSRIWRTIFKQRAGVLGEWSDPAQVLPMDLVGEASYRLGQAVVLDNKIFLTCLLRRDNGPAFHAYMTGQGGNFAIARDMFISELNTGSGARPGHLFLDSANHTVWYVHAGGQYHSRSTSLVGDQAAERTTQTQLVNEIELSDQPGSPAALTMTLAAEAVSGNIRQGSEAVLEVAYNGSYANLGTFDIDSLQTARDGEGQGASISGAHKGLGRMASMQADYDLAIQSCIRHTCPVNDPNHWIQAKGLLDKLYDDEPPGRTIGDFARSAHYGEELIRYISEPEASGWLVRMKFNIPPAPTKSRAGAILNYTTTEQAEPSGVAVIWGEEEHSDGQGFGIYTVLHGTWTKVSSTASAHSLGSEMQLLASYLPSVVKVWKLSGGVWTLVIDLAVALDDALRQAIQTGRAALYLQENTPNVSCLGIAAQETYLPVTDNSILPPGKILIGEYGDRRGEQLTVISDGPNAGGPMNEDYWWAPQAGYDFKGRPGYRHDNLYSGPWAGYPVWAVQQIDNGRPALATLHDQYNGYALCVTSGPDEGKVYHVTDWDWSAPYQWTPNDPNGYAYPDTWMDHVGQTGHGAWATGPTMVRWFVQEPVSSYFSQNSRIEIRQAHTVTRGAAQNFSGLGGLRAWQYVGNVSPEINRLECVEFLAFSRQKDWTIQEAFTAVAHSAGVFEVETEKRAVAKPTPNGRYWNLASNASETKVSQRAFCLEIALQNDGVGDLPREIGLCGLDGGSYTGMVTICKAYPAYELVISRYAFSGGTPVLVEQIAAAASNTAVRFSQLDGTLCVWSDARLVYACPWAEAPEVFLAALDMPQDHYSIDWDVKDSLTQDWVMEYGASPLENASRLLNERRMLITNRQNGVKLLSAGKRETANLGDPTAYALAVKEAKHTGTAALKTRVSLEGTEIYEVADYNLMRQYGNRFSLVQIMDLLTPEDFVQEGAGILEDVNRAIDAKVYSGTADLRLEAGDQYRILLPEGEITVIVNALSLKVQATQDAAMSVMEVSCVDA